MPIDEKLLLDLCGRAAREMNTKKLRALMEQINRMIAELLDDSEHPKPS